MDTELKLRNFEEAGKALAEVWNLNIIDGYPIVAEYRPPAESTELEEMDWFSERWKAAHIYHGQYCFQIVECENQECCKLFCSNLLQVLPGRLLPPLVKFRNSEKGPEACSIQEDEEGYFGTFPERVAVSGLEPM